MTEHHVFPVPESWAERAWADEATYFKMYEQSIADPEAFWGEHGKRIDWFKPFTQVKDVSFGPGDVHIKWFQDGTLNASHNCLDRHLETRGDQTAIIWEGDDPKDDKKITYRELHESVCRLANGLKEIGVQKGDRVTIYMPMIPEAAVAMLACTRVGAVHSVVFGGFSPDSLAGRIQDCDSNILITADEGLRGGRKVPLKKNLRNESLPMTWNPRILLHWPSPPVWSTPWAECANRACCPRPPPARRGASSPRCPLIARCCTCSCTSSRQE